MTERGDFGFGYKVGYQGMQRIRSERPGVWLGELKPLFPRRCAQLHLPELWPQMRVPPEDRGPAEAHR